MEMDEDTRIALYCYLGFTYKEILCSLALNHHIVISLFILRERIIEKKYFFRRQRYTDILAIYDKLKPFGQCIIGCIDRFS